MKINKKEAMDLWNNGLLDTEIAKHFNCSKVAVCVWRRKNDLPHNRWLVSGKTTGGKRHVESSGFDRSLNER